MLAALGVLLVKFAARPRRCLLLAPKVKLFTTSASMLVSIGAYSLIWVEVRDRPVLLLLVHELGHVIQLRREGIPPRRRCSSRSGALVAMKELPKDAAAEARVGLAGPVLGSLAALVPLALYGLTGDELFKALAFVGFFLNLFNLLPVLPLDGGRAMAALSPWMWLAGYALLIAAAIAFPNPIMILILLFGGLETWRRWRERKSPESREFHRVRRPPGRDRGLPRARRGAGGGHGRDLPGSRLRGRLGPPLGTIPNWQGALATALSMTETRPSSEDRNGRERHAGKRTGSGADRGGAAGAGRRSRPPKPAGPRS